MSKTVKVQVNALQDAVRPHPPAHPAHALGVRPQAGTGTLVSDEQITIPKLTAQILFDALVHSMDFGSGFLDTEEVEALRGMATALGVDPAVATPAEFEAGYAHAFDPMDPAMIGRVYTPYVARQEPEAPGGWATERHDVGA